MKLTTNLELGRYFTFESSKDLPIHNWFYYKEGFAPQVVQWALQQEKIDSKLIAQRDCCNATMRHLFDASNNRNSKLLLDPFCGVGTSLLTAKSHGLNAIGC